MLSRSYAIFGAAKSTLSYSRKNFMWRKYVGLAPIIDRKGSTDNSQDELLVEVSNGIRKITLNRPEKKNALTKQMAISLIFSLVESNEDADTNVVVVTGSSDYFTSGIDLVGFSKPKPSSTENEGPKNEETQTENAKKSSKKNSGIQLFVQSLIDCKKPLIALVNGPAVGFGVTMLGLFDGVYCSDKATFQTRFTEYGLTAELCSTYTFPRIMGYGKANQLLMFNTKMNSAEAFDCGLVSKIFPHDRFMQDSFQRVQEISKLPVKSLVYSKQLVRGREREILIQVNREEQSKFDPEVAREVKRKFAEKMLQK